jgi:hypothetical protein
VRAIRGGPDHLCDLTTQLSRCKAWINLSLYFISKFSCTIGLEACMEAKSISVLARYLADIRVLDKARAPRMGASIAAVTLHRQMASIRDIGINLVGRFEIRIPTGVYASSIADKSSTAAVASPCPGCVQSPNRNRCKLSIQETYSS